MMASTPKQVNGSSGGPLGKRKKSRGNKGSYLSKWLDKSLHHIQDSTPSMETFETYVNPNLNWPLGSSQFAPGYDPYRYMYGCPEPMSLPTLPSYCNPAVPPLYNHEYRYTQSANKSIQVQRPRMRRRSDKVEEVHSPNSTLSNTNYLQPKNFTDSQDFASLPPIVTSVADTNSNSEMNNNDKDDGSNNRRFSDPCVRGLPDVARPANRDVDSDSESSSDLSGSQVGSRLLTHLLDQIKCLKFANERLNKELLDTKAELDNVRQQNVILQKGSSSSIGANHSPLTDSGVLGGQYSPGFLADLVREIRDAARVREEAMYSRVRAMVHERTDNNHSSEAKYAEKALEEIKSSLRASEADRRRMMDRVSKLEDELRMLRVTGINNSIEANDTKATNGNADDAETQRMRKELADMRKAKQNAEEHALKLERLVTQLRSKFNGLAVTSGPESLPSDAELEPGSRARRTSNNSANNSAVLFGPVTDL
ncbi:hypothetical protein ABMA28_007849 [Loxostege sticticalis]|uniref:Uncharacterized protein n=1 Tax=Loxostege sticticalis TaxID=481309 RepID=A0ABD0SJ93_LOXSC